MDLSNPPDENEVSLLTIPRSDLFGSAGGASSSSSSTTPRIVLLKLPPQWTVDDLQRAHFVAPPTLSSQVACVVESKQCSFSVHRVETSNALVMVPPPPPSPLPDDNENEPMTKKCKLGDPTLSTASGKTLTVVPTRLLKAGGSGACFLELRPKPLSRIDLLSQLQGCLLNPYAIAQTTTDCTIPYLVHASATATGTTNACETAGSALLERSMDDNDEEPTVPFVGRTVADLSTALQCSTFEVQTALEQIQAYALPRTTPRQYARLAEEALAECYLAIVSTLAEEDGWDQYASAPGIVVREFVAQAVQRLGKQERFIDADEVIRHCLQQLRADGQNRESDTFCLNVPKVCVAACPRLRILQVRISLLTLRSPRLPLVLFSGCFKNSLLLGIKPRSFQCGNPIYQASETLTRFVATCCSVLRFVSKTTRDPCGSTCQRKVYRTTPRPALTLFLPSRNDGRCGSWNRTCSA
jgi:Sister chromatid cohesion protein Dcc1